MSYVVHLWDQAQDAAPSTLQDADRLHERLASSPAAANPKFAQLAQALIERFPAEVGGRGGASESWVESPPDGLTDTRVYSLGLYDEGITRLLPVLVEQATALGLTVYDDQAGRLYLPGGRMLDEGGVRALNPTAAIAEPGLTLAQAKARFQALVVPALAPWGFRFKAEKGQWHLARSCPLGEQRITLAVHHDGSRIEFKPTGTVTPALPPGLAPAIGPSVSVWFDTRDCQPIAHRHWVNRNATLGRFDLRAFAVREAAALDDFLQSYRELLIDAVLPLLEAARSAPGFVEADLKPEGWKACFKPGYATLAVAHWVGCAEFDALARAHVERDGANPGTMRIQAMVVGRLKALPQYFGIYPRMEPA